MAAEETQETVWEDLKLAVQRRPDHWQLFVYDVEKCDVLYTAERMKLRVGQGCRCGVCRCPSLQHGPR